MENEIIKEYTKGDLTVIWKPKKCIHSAKCVHGLPDVFKPKEKPWIQLDNCDIEHVKTQIDNCPSGALAYKKEKTNNMENQELENQVSVEVIPNGPLAVHSSCTIKLSDGTVEEKANKAFFCRCGASANKPFCDGTHKSIEFNG